MNVVLVGYRGTGKSAVAQVLAGELELQVVSWTRNCSGRPASRFPRWSTASAGRDFATWRSRLSVSSPAGTAR